MIRQVRDWGGKITSMLVSDAKQDAEPLVGISVSAVSLLALACLSGLVLFPGGLFFLVKVLFVGSTLGGTQHGIVWKIGATIFLASGFGFCVITFRAWKALYAEQAWALWVARTWAVLLLLFGATDLYRLYPPHTPIADEYFGLLYDPLFILSGSAWLLYLVLPKVRARFRASRSSAS